MPKLTLQDLVQIVGGELIGDPTLLITGINDLESAKTGQIAFLENNRYQKFLLSTQASCIILEQKLLPKEHQNRAYLVHPNPSKAFQQLIELFIEMPSSGFQGIHPTALIHPSVQLGKDLHIGPYVVIDQGSQIGDRTQIGAGCVIGPEVIMGPGCVIHPRVTIEQKSHLGTKVVVQSGAVIGSCGFGYHTDKQGKHHAYPHLGNVILEDEVEVGANTTIDRARFKSTVVGKGTKIDNLVQIAHQVHLGESNLVVAQVGIAGSTTTGKNVVMGGQVGVAGHITLADHVVLTARAAVSKSLDKADVYYGAPAMPDKEFKRHFLALRKVERMIGRFQQLEKRFAHLFEEEESEPSLEI